MPKQVDLHAGRRMRQRRWMLGMTQQQLADQIGVRSPQVQKYETAENRIGASRLWEIATVLEVPVTYFFEGIGAEPADTHEARGEILTDKEAQELVGAYYAVPEDQRRRLFDLAMLLSEASTRRRDSQIARTG